MLKLTMRSSTKTIIDSADRFLKEHRQDPAASLTFGYFTHHPVAPLNQIRLTYLLEETQKKAATLTRPLRVLDLACGGGIITNAIAQFGHRVLGLDLDPNEIRLAQLFTQEQKLDGIFAQADLLNDPHWETKAEQSLGGKADLVILAYALHHIPQVELFVARLSKWLPTGAVVLVNEENPQSPLFRLKHLVRGWIQKDTEVEHHRTIGGWESLLRSVGLNPFGPLRGADPLPGLSVLAPQKCWSVLISFSKPSLELNQ